VFFSGPRFTVITKHAAGARSDRHQAGGDGRFAAAMRIISSTVLPHTPTAPAVGQIKARPPFAVGSRAIGDAMATKSQAAAARKSTKYCAPVPGPSRVDLTSTAQQLQPARDRGWWRQDSIRCRTDWSSILRQRIRVLAWVRAGRPPLAQWMQSQSEDRP